MEFELEDRSQQMGEDDALDIAGLPASPQRERRRYAHPGETARPRQDQALFIPEQEAGTG